MIYMRTKRSYHAVSVVNYNDYVDYLNFMIRTCFSIYQGTGEDQKERCCLPLDFQCDGAMDCSNGENTVSFGFYVDTRTSGTAGALSLVPCYAR